MEGYKDPRKENEHRAFESVKIRLGTVFELFEEQGVTEVNINGCDDIWISRFGKRVQMEGMKLEEIDLNMALRALASAMGQDVSPDDSRCMVHAKMPGYRFAGCLAPTSSRGTSISIRKHSPRVLALSDYVKSGQMPQAIADWLADQVKIGSNILIGGGTDSGKTTFLNALSREIPADERVATIEDTRELTILVPNWIPFEYNKQAGITAQLCVDMCMRSSPDRIIAGELKDETAANFLEAANTGHHGCMATTHANSSYESLARVELLTLRAGLGWPLPAIRQQVASTIHAVVHLRKRNGRRELNEVARIVGYDHSVERYKLELVHSVDNPEMVVGV